LEFFLTQQHNTEASHNKFAQKTPLENFEQLLNKKCSAIRATNFLTPDIHDYAIFSFFYCKFEYHFLTIVSQHLKVLSHKNSHQYDTYIVHNKFSKPVQFIEQLQEN